MRYADELELGEGNRDFMWEVVHKVDLVYLRMVNEKLEENRRHQDQARRRPPL